MKKSTIHLNEQIGGFLLNVCRRRRCCYQLNKFSFVNKI